MATKAKSKKRSVKKRVVKKPLAKTLKAFGRTYKKKACSKTKAAATKSANASRKAGKTAMVKKNPTGGYCTFVGAKRKTIRAKSLRVSINKRKKS